MPFVVNSPDLPSNVKALNAELKAQWIEIWNSVFEKCQADNGDDCETVAFQRANGVIKTRQEERMKLSEALKVISEASHAALGALKDLRQEIEGLELEEDRSGRVMAALELLEQVFAPKDDEEDPEHPDDEDEPEMEEDVSATETASEAFSESLTSGAITIAEVNPPGSVRDPLAIKVRLIKAGPGNPIDKHYYPGDVLRRDAHVFENVKMYTVLHDESKRTEPTEVGKVRKIIEFEEDGSPIADVIIWHPEFAERTRNRAKAGELDSLECSILAKGIAKEADIDGKTFNVVESIESAQAIDFVPNAGAGGKAVGIAESDKPEPEAGVGKQTEVPDPEPPKPLLEKERVLSVLRETNLPKLSQDRLAEGEYQTDEVLAEAIVHETEYVKSISGSGQPLGGGAAQPMTETKTVEQQRQESAEKYEKLREHCGLAPR